MARWLLKSEPEAFSIEDLARRPGRRAGWDGVRNYQARNNLRAMRPGDLAFFYHSNASPSAVVGVVRVVRAAYPDPSQFDPKSPAHDPASRREAPRWLQVDVRLVKRFKRPVGLEEIRAQPGLLDMGLLKSSRLSVQQVSPRHWQAILQLASPRGRRA